MYLFTGYNVQSRGGTAEKAVNMYVYEGKRRRFHYPHLPPSRRGSFRCLCKNFHAIYTGHFFFKDENIAVDAEYQVYLKLESLKPFSHLSTKAHGTFFNIKNRAYFAHTSAWI